MTLTTVFLFVIAGGLVIRSRELAGYGHRAAYPDIVAHYGSLAASLEAGRGFVTTLTGQGEDLANNSPDLVEWKTLRPFNDGVAARPIPYYVPGYPLAVAAVWTLTGGQSYHRMQLLQILADGVVGSLAVFALLACVGRARAGIWAAALYATSAFVADIATEALPDSLANAMTMMALAFVVVGARLKRPILSAAASGITLGLLSWFRGDALLTMIAVAAACWVFSQDTRAKRRRTIGALLAAGAVPLVLLTVFYGATYGDWQFNRPGAGVRLWAGISQQANPWGIEAPQHPGANIDEAAGNLDRANGLAYGYWRGDAFLLKDALTHYVQDPGFFVAPTVARFIRVATVLGDHPLPWPANLSWTSVMPLVLLGSLRLWRYRFVAGLALAIWLSRVVPFSFLYESNRDVALLIPLYALCLAVLIDDAIEILSPGRSPSQMLLRPSAPGL